MPKKKEKTKTIEIYDVYINGRLKPLVHPLKIEVERDRERRYILYEPELQLFAVNKDISKGIEGIKKDFDMLWKSCTALVDNRSSPEQKKFKEKVLKMVKM